MMKHSLIITLIAFIFFLSSATSASADSRETKRVLVLYSLEKGNVGQERMDAQLQSIFRNNKTFDIQIYNEYLDLIRFPEANQISRLTNFLHQKYAREQPDVVLTVLTPALDTLEQHGGELLREVVAIAQGELNAQNILIETHLDETLPSVIADKTQIQQVALNLMMNAMDTMAKSAPDKKKIIIQTELRDGFVQTAFHDYGPGISAEQVDRVFDPFYTTKNNGLGMGLAVCKSIITSHEGQIRAENNPEGGTTLSFALKAADRD
jgi:signal transduction histidine kinase